MKKIFAFFYELYKATDRNELIPLATELTYRLIFALFPFIIFLMSLIGYFNIDSRSLVSQLSGAIPDQVLDLFRVFVYEVVDVKNVGVLSTSLLLTVFSAAGGLRAIMRGINKSYEQKETRNVAILWVISVFLVVVLAVSIVISISVLIYGDSIYKILQNYFPKDWFRFFFGLAGNLATMFVLLVAVIVIYKLGSCKKLTVNEILPGAMITLIIWMLASKVFNIYVNNFSKYSKIYGSIASIFILMLWINIISIIILLGAEINALLSDKKNSGD